MLAAQDSAAAPVLDVPAVKRTRKHLADDSTATVILDSAQLGLLPTHQYIAADSEAKTILDSAAVNRARALEADDSTASVIIDNATMAPAGAVQICYRGVRVTTPRLSIRARNPLGLKVCTERLSVR